MRRIHFSTLLALSACNSFLHASDQLDPVIIESKQTDTYFEQQAGNTGTANKTYIDNLPLLRVGEIIEIVPGMVATQHSGNGKANQYFLRGFNLDHGTDFLTTVDDMPVNLRTHGHGQGYTDLSFVIPETIEQVQYKKGPYYADTGDFSSTGSANLKTVQSLPSDLASLTLGEHGYTRGLLLSQTELDNSNVLVALEGHTNEGPWESISEDLKKSNLMLKQTWGDWNDQFSITFMNYDNQWNSADQVPQRAIEQGVIGELGSIDTSLGGDSRRRSISASWVNIKENWSHKASTYSIYYDMNLWSNFTYNTQVNGDQFKQVDNRFIHGGRWTSNFSKQFLNRPSVFTFGAEFRIDDIKEVGLYNTNNRTITSAIRSDAVKQSELSLFTKHQIQWSSKWSSTLGVRFGMFDFEVIPESASNPTTLNANSGSQSDSILSTNFSTTYQLNESQFLYGNIGEGYHSNDARGVIQTMDPVTGDPVDSADPLVKTLGYEIGFFQDWGRNASFNVSLWYLEIGSELLFVGDEGTTEDTGTGSKRHGVEISLSTPVNQQLDVKLDYAYTQAKLTDAESSPIPGALEHVASLSAHYQVNDQLFTMLRYRYFGEYPLDDGQVADESAIANLRAGYQFNQAASLYIDIMNLLDSDDKDVTYYYASQLASESAPVEDFHYHVFEPRTVRLTFNYSF